MTTPQAASPPPQRSWMPEFLLLSAIWGASFLFMRVGAAEFGPFATAGLRVALAALVLTPFMVLKGEWPALRKHWKQAMLAGVINSAIPFALFAWAVMHITTGLTSILNATVPLFGALVAWIWLGERIAGLRWVGLLVGFVGVALLAWKAPGGAGMKSEDAVWAIGACLCASTCYAIAANYAKRYLVGVPPLASATGSLMGATLCLAIPAIMNWPAQMPGARAWAAIVAIAILCTGIAYFLYFRLIVIAGPSQAVAVTFLAPAFAVVYGAVFLHEPVTAWMLGCGVIIVCGTMMSTGLIGSARQRT
ncbi:DMT family transporter [Diaphorobacter aerolatus]|uniref:DMT family transporter n=1 Tax=Diaphorobacter aerolatus TaxID=1288495 RepID=A0A7H0GLL0_9BURK|nr:DMT family transporter [Diaphorobacter aerolatus]QNP49176.1 DMT family transporter [Diaphorobacter aerolatus]